MQARRSSLYRRILTGPQPICWLTFDDNTVANGGLIHDRVSSRTMTFHTTDTLANAWKSSPIDSYAINCRSDTGSGRTRYLSTIADDRFYINGGSQDKPFTITAWVKIHSHTGYYRIAGIYTNNKTTVAQWIVCTESTGELSLYVYDFVVGGSGGYIRKRSTLKIGLNTWMHLAWTYRGNRSGSGINLYKNGSLLPHHGNAERKNFTKVRPSTAKLEGQAINVNGSILYGKGMTDHFKFFDQELTAAEVLADYNLNKP